jgi:hypothetical protein
MGIADIISIVVAIVGVCCTVAKSEIKLNFGYKAKIQFAQKTLKNNVDIYNSLSNKNSNDAKAKYVLERVIQDQSHELEKCPEYYKNETIKNGKMISISIKLAVASLVLLIAASTISDALNHPIFLKPVLLILLPNGLTLAILSFYIVLASKGYREALADANEIVFSKVTMTWVAVGEKTEANKDTDGERVQSG